MNVRQMTGVILCALGILGASYDPAPAQGLLRFNTDIGVGHKGNRVVQGNYIGTDVKRRGRAGNDGRDIGSFEGRRKLTDNSSPLPQNRKANRKPSTDSNIFDRWGRGGARGNVGDPQGNPMVHIR